MNPSRTYASPTVPAPTSLMDLSDKELWDFFYEAWPIGSNLYIVHDNNIHTRIQSVGHIHFGYRMGVEGCTHPAVEKNQILWLDSNGRLCKVSSYNN